MSWTNGGNCKIHNIFVLYERCTWLTNNVKKKKKNEILEESVFETNVR